MPSERFISHAAHLPLHTDVISAWLWLCYYAGRSEVEWNRPIIPPLSFSYRQQGGVSAQYSRLEKTVWMGL